MKAVEDGFEICGFRLFIVGLMALAGLGLVWSSYQLAGDWGKFLRVFGFDYVFFKGEFK